MRKLMACLVALAATAVSANAGLINGSFETPRFTPGVPDFIQINQSSVPGWRTTSTDGLIELWSDGFDGFHGVPVPSYHGAQHAELNATQVANLFQDAPGIPAGSVVGFQFAHRGRIGVDVMRLRITDLGADNAPGGTGLNADTLLYSALYSDGTAWGFYTNPFPLFALGNTVRFSYESVSAAGGNQAIGNLLDAADFGVGVGNTAIPEPLSVAVFGGLVAAGGVVARRRMRVA
jgi:hypothetical protein